MSHVFSMLIRVPSTVTQSSRVRWAKAPAKTAPSASHDARSPRSGRACPVQAEAGEQRRIEAIIGAGVRAVERRGRPGCCRRARLSTGPLTAIPAPARAAPRPHHPTNHPVNHHQLFLGGRWAAPSSERRVTLVSPSPVRSSDRFRRPSRPTSTPRGRRSTSPTGWPHLAPAERAEACAASWTPRRPGRPDRTDGGQSVPTPVGTAHHLCPDRRPLKRTQPLSERWCALTSSAAVVHHLSVL
jgi:hypothetical protein